MGPVCAASLQSHEPCLRRHSIFSIICFSHDENNPSFFKKKKKINQDTHTYNSQIKPFIILPQEDQHYSSFYVNATHTFFSI